LNTADSTKMKNEEVFIGNE